jgi:HAE1 family hydrophobic/amphiphilic exporter-1
LEQLANFRAVVILLFFGSLGITGWFFLQVPLAFIPEEDQGYFITLIQAPEGVSLNYTSAVMRQVETRLRQEPEVVGTFAVGGFGFNGSNPNSAVIFTTLKPWSERHKAEESASAVVNRVRGAFGGIKEALVIPFNPPSIQGLGSFGGFQYELQDKGGNGIPVLAQASGELIGKANQTPGLVGVFSTFKADTPQLLIQVDRDRAKRLQVDIADIFNTLQTFLGSRYVNDFNLFGQTYRVYVQADQPFRSNPQAIQSLYVRSQTGQMIPLGNLVTVSPTTAPQTITHYNLFRSIEINGAAAPGYSSGQALAVMEQVSKEVLPLSMGFEWSGIALEEQRSGGQAPFIFALGIIFVFLVLAAQYESWTDPFIILLAVPLAILGALLAQSFRGFANDVYCQIGLVMLIGLASKNAILIVEFANQLRKEGGAIAESVFQAASERLRPILMTAFAFILGVWPLVTASGAGSASRQSLGTAVFGGMIVSTLLSLFVVPVLYIVINDLRERFGRNLKRMPVFPAAEE